MFKDNEEITNNARTELGYTFKRFSSNDDNFIVPPFRISFRLSDILHTYARCYRKNFATTIRDFLWAGIFYKENQRKEKGLVSLVELTQNYKEKDREKMKKQLEKEVQQEITDISDVIWGIKKQ